MPPLRSTCRDQLPIPSCRSNPSRARSRCRSILIQSMKTCRRPNQSTPQYRVQALALRLGPNVERICDEAEWRHGARWQAPEPQLASRTVTLQPWHEPCSMPLGMNPPPSPVEPALPPAWDPPAPPQPEPAPLPPPEGDPQPDEPIRRDPPAPPPAPGEPIPVIEDPPAPGEPPKDPGVIARFD